MEPIRVLIIDEQPLYREGCRGALERAGDCTVIAEAAASRDGLELARIHAPDVALIDALLPSGDALDMARHIRRESPSTAIIILTALEDEEQLFQAMKLGAAAYLQKNLPADELVAAVRKVSRGTYIINDSVLARPNVAKRVLGAFRGLPAEEPPAAPTAVPLYSPLSTRETEILDYIARGNSNKEIAKSLAISDQTVKNHITSILKKLAVNDRTAAVVHALRHGWIALDGDSDAAARRQAPQT